jgi:hypothetical protein
MNCLHKINLNFKFQPPFIFVKVVFLKVVHPLKICHHTKLQSHVDSYKLFIRLRISNMSPSPYSKPPAKKVMTHIKLVGVSMFFDCTVRRLSKSNAS